MMRKALLFALAALAATVALDAAPAPGGQYLAYVSTYTNRQRAQGIYAYRFDSATGKFTSLGLAAETPDPSFFIIHPNRKFLYAVSEFGAELRSYEIDLSTGMLKLLNKVPSKGEYPVHLALDQTRKWLFDANYRGGTTVVFPVREDGTLGEANSLVQHVGSSVLPRRQDAPHPHGVYISTDNRFLFVPDLGLDKIMSYRFDAAKGTISANEPDSVKVAPGSGPRHLAFHPNNKFVYAMNEYTSSITAYTFDAGKGTLTQFQAHPALPPDFTGTPNGGEIAVHPNGKFLYASNLNHDSIAIFTIDGNGKITAAGHVPTQGTAPRHFAIDPTGAFLIVSNQNTDNIVVFRIDQATGGLKPTGETVKVGMPVCLDFVALE